MAATLYSLSTSHPALAVRGMLDLKGIDYRVVDLWPGFHPVVVRLRGFRGGTVPALVIDGRRIQGSRAIARALDALRPDPPLFPREPEARRGVEEAERWGDEVLQDVPRRLIRWMVAHSYEARRWLAVDASGVPLGGVLARPPFQARAFAKASGATDDAVRADIAALPGLLDRASALIEEGVIGGEQPNAADFQIASTLRAIANIGDLAPHVADHPAIRWSATLIAQPLPGPVPRILPPEWLEPLERAPA
jgi:glutathione S-transferase